MTRNVLHHGRYTVLVLSAGFHGATSNDRSQKVGLEYYVTIYRRPFVPAQKPYWIITFCSDVEH